MKNKPAKGFTACGKFYPMSDEPECYIEYCKKLLNEIHLNSKK